MAPLSTKKVNSLPCPSPHCQLYLGLLWRNNNLFGKIMGNLGPLYLSSELPLYSTACLHVSPLSFIFYPSAFPLLSLGQSFFQCPSSLQSAHWFSSRGLFLSYSFASSDFLFTNLPQLSKYFLVGLFLTKSEITNFRTTYYFPISLKICLHTLYICQHNKLSNL